MRNYHYSSVVEYSLTVPQKDIFYISWNIDACEGLALLETVDAKEGRVKIYAPAALHCDILHFIDGLRAEGIPIEIDDTKEL